MMKVLFDRGVPDGLRAHLAPHEVALLRERGWSELRNGELLRRAQAEFDILLTTDTNIEHQQNLLSFALALIVLRAFKISLQKYLPLVPKILATLETIQAGQVVYLYADERLRPRDERKGKR